MNMMSDGNQFESIIGRSRIDEKRAKATEASIKRYLPTATGRPVYDSAVIAGNGIGALSFAARLARHPEFAGRITVVAPPIVESRRLINGVSLRGLAADYISAALGCTHSQLLDAISDPTSGPPVCYRQNAAMSFKGKNGQWEFTRSGVWQGGQRGGERPLVYGVRNTRVTAGMTEILADAGIDFVEEKATSADQLRLMAKGSKPLLVNATVNSGLLGNPGEKPKRMVFAVQVAFSVAPGGIKAPLQSGTAFAPLIRRAGIIDVGYFTPFSDPLSPNASWYGIVARVVDADADYDKQAEIGRMTEELFGMADALGLVPDDPDETMASALIPAAPFGGKVVSAPGTLELKRCYAGGPPCYYADGMISAAMGGVIGADAIATGADAGSLVRNSLKAIRWHNRLWWIETTRIAPIADALMRINVNLAMAYPHSAGLRLWAAHA